MLSKEHLDEDVLERYAMSTSSEFEAEEVEDHTALCAHCMDRLDGAKAFVSVIRKALVANPAKELFSARLSKWLHSAHPVWAAGAVAAALLLFVAVKPAPIAPLGAISTVAISGTRGTSTVVHGAGPFDFAIFMPEAVPKYHAELLDQAGAKNWVGDVAGENGNVHVVVNRRIAAGQYFLRVTEPSSGAVHEFGLKIEH